MLAFPERVCVCVCVLNADSVFVKKLQFSHDGRDVLQAEKWTGLQMDHM